MVYDWAIFFLFVYFRILAVVSVFTTFLNYSQTSVSGPLLVIGQRTDDRHNPHLKARLYFVWPSETVIMKLLKAGRTKGAYVN